MTKSVYYKYLFYDWLFKNMQSAKNKTEERLSWLHNQRNRHYLIIYMLRWFVITCITFSGGYISEKIIVCLPASACCFIGTACAIPILVVTFVAWLFLGLTKWQD